VPALAGGTHNVQASSSATGLTCLVLEPNGPNAASGKPKKLGRSHAAIAMYERSLDCLIEDGDEFRPAQVYLDFIHLIDKKG
jgi:hypothetical protein